MQIHFDLHPPEHGWPPVAVESVWAEALGDGAYRVDGPPWFVLDLAVGDVVTAVPDAAGRLRPTGDVRRSGRLTVRVVPAYEGSLRGDPVAVLDVFRPYGVAGKVQATYRVVALDIGPDADLHALKSLLDAGEAEDDWFYEEGSVNEAWCALP
ncbi:MAG: hypothetical protein JWN46_990 [Acidimicrobiales bacterium]|nr:hypothetical protein [Acidimicrobiales bacterium]